MANNALKHAAALLFLVATGFLFSAGVKDNPGPFLVASLFGVLGFVLCLLLRFDRYVGRERVVRMRVAHELHNLREYARSPTHETGVAGDAARFKRLDSSLADYVTRLYRVEEER
jgi:hypothetical protein